MNRKWIILIILALLLLSACSKQKKQTQVKTDAVDEAIPVLVEPLQPRELDDYVSLTGKVEGITDITMSSETSGRILKLYKQLGDYVAKGQKIGEIDNEVTRIRLEQAKAGLASAQASFENAELYLKSSEKLYQAKNISLAEYNSALSSFKGAKAGLDGAKSNLESARKAYDNSFLDAPESGYIANMSIKVGEYINPGQVVAVIVDNRQLLVKSGVGESQISKIKKGQLVEISAPELSAPINGKVKAFGIKPLQTTASYPVEISLPNPGMKLLPGMVVNCKIRSGAYQSLLFTSVNNIAKQYDRTYIFVINSKKEAEKRQVRLGREINGNVIILDGVKAGDLIVTSGVENLENGTKVQIKK